MNTEIHQITVSGFTIDVVRKDIKNLHLAVYPPTGRVRIATPLALDDEAVRLFAISKLRWIKRHQANFQSQERQSGREYVSGESHYYQGNRYLLNVIYTDAKPYVTIPNKTTIDLIVPTGSDPSYRERILTLWYRQQLKAAAGSLITKWEAQIGVQVSAWGIKQMKTKWGTCNTEARRIWLNLELIKKPAHCIEYVIVHELVHLQERHHNDKFISTMNTHLPQWRLYSDELNRAPLGNAVWSY